MANPAVFPCRRADDFPEAEMKAQVTECFSPDILHVFRDEQQDEDNNDNNNPPSPSVLSRSPCGQATARISPSSFPQFRNLPPELRFLIWEEAALPEPTVVVPRTWNNAKFRYNLQRKVPPVLQACAESRGLLVAQPGPRGGGSAAHKYQLVQTRGRDDEGVYMNFDRESIWIYRGSGYANLQSLVMNWGLRPCWVDSAVDKGVRFIQRFPRLRLLTLLVDFSEHGWPEPSTLKGLRRLKRNEVKRIWSLVRGAFRRAEERDPDGWTAPRLRIVHRTENWSRQEAK
ncbi:hypothetical protein VMCG_04204 [Cytospora schulzeri]|uniref:2EXR domain-containing protein n=1 Tax=Cytospora schulzeri TaxID=448051 RepID=A0A423WTU4_9PEZI|nr:hypothetical protein VMCG_04204 [Valsa malicola]